MEHSGFVTVVITVVGAKDEVGRGIVGKVSYVGRNNV